MNKNLPNLEFDISCNGTVRYQNRSQSAGKPLMQMLAAILSLFLLIGISSEGAYAQASPSDLQATDLSKVLQAILDAPELQKYFPVNSDNSLKQISIVQYPFSFPADLSVSKGGKVINFVSNTDLAQNKPEAYFMFRRVDGSASSAKLIFHYFYNVNEQSSKILSGVVDLQKSGSTWAITNANFGGDK